MKIESVALATLALDPANARKHDQRNVDAIKGSLARFGQQKPIVVGKGNVIIAGNGTFEAARALGWEKVNVVKTKLEGTEASAFALADNRTAELAAWDNDALTATLKALSDDGFPIADIGFEDFDFSVPPETQCDEDEVPEAVEPKSKPGDFYQLGAHRLLCGDSTNVQHVERLMAGEKADMVFTDPPYNVGYEGNIWSSGHIKTGKPDWEGGIKNDKMSSHSFDEFIANVYVSIDLVVKSGASIYICYPSGRDGWSFTKAWAPMPWHFQSTLVWLKSHLLISRWDYHPIYEPILYGWKEGSAHKFHGERNQACVLNHKSAIRQNESGLHPTQKPISLMEQCINNSSLSKCLLFEPFGGSGSTLIACEKTGRRCFGMEIDPHYCDIIVARWEKYTGKTAQLTSEKDTV